MTTFALGHVCTFHTPKQRDIHKTKKKTGGAGGGGEEHRIRNTLFTSPGSRSLKVRNSISQDLVRGLYMSQGCPSTRARMDFLQYHSLKSRNLK